LIRLYHNAMSTSSQKVRCILAEKDIDWEGFELNIRAGEQYRPEFLSINPKGVVPVIDHHGNMVRESSVIMQYLEETFPGTVLLMPEIPYARSQVRLWLQRLDAGVHLAVAALSIGIAFRSSLLGLYPTSAALEGLYLSVPDASLRAIYQDVLPNGESAIAFKSAILSCFQILRDMESTLLDQEFLVGHGLSLADFALLPYVVRLDHLQLRMQWDDAPSVTRWYKRMRATKGYEKGICQWLSPEAVNAMKREGLRYRKLQEA
jgi:glutathione S-transferase